MKAEPSGPASRGRICVHCPGLYPALVPGSAPYVGGLETQQAIVLRGLRARGFDASAVSCGYGQPALEKVDGIRVYRSFVSSEGLPLLRFFHPRLSGMVRALVAADADVYLAQGSGLMAGVTYDVARARRKPFVFVVAHDDDVKRQLPQQRRPHEKWWYRRALQGARLVLAQTNFQRDLLGREFGVASHVLANPMPIPPQPIDSGQPGAVVWVATYKASKRPMWVVEAARRMPEQRFVMYGVVPPPPSSADAWREVREAAETLPNLDAYTEPVNSRLDEVYRGASLFVHASSSEGLPNTFLEAWARGVPGVTAFDPDGIISSLQLGTTVVDLEGFVSAIRAWLADPGRRREAGARARTYVEQRHSETRVVDRLAELLDPLVAESRRT